MCCIICLIPQTEIQNHMRVVCSKKFIFLINSYQFIFYYVADTPLLLMELYIILLILTRYILFFYIEVNYQSINNKNKTNNNSIGNCGGICIKKIFKYLDFVWKYMEEEQTDRLFSGYLNRESVFFDKRVIQTSYIPESVPHRDEQIKQIANILAPTLKMEKPSNIFIYGKTGTGKTLITKHTTQKLTAVGERERIPIKVIYINCKLRRSTDTEYRLIAQIAREMGRVIPPTGLPTEEVYKIFLKALNKQRLSYILVLDEIDQLVSKTGDNVLYNLTRISEEKIESDISIIGISNDIMFVDGLDPRVRSSLSEEEIIVPPYNAIQIQSILKERVEMAFHKDVLGEGVIEKCAAYAARDHGDARRALELLRVAGEVADRKNVKKIIIDYVDEAEEKIDRDRITDIVTTQPKQYQLVLQSIIFLQTDRKTNIFTGEVYEIYKSLCKKTNTSILTQRRVSDIISEFDMLGIVNAKVISKGRYGRTREISLEIPDSVLLKVKNILKEGIQI